MARHNTLFITIILSVSMLSACHKPADDNTCKLYIPPAASSLRFRIFSATTGVDLFLAQPPYRLNMDSLRAVQPCYSDSLAKEIDQYTLPGSGLLAVSFTFSNLRNSPLSEAGTECFAIYLRWNSTDQDTVLWNYHEEQSGACKYQVVDFVSFNGQAADKVDDGAFTYYALRKNQ